MGAKHCFLGFLAGQLGLYVVCVCVCVKQAPVDGWVAEWAYVWDLEKYVRHILQTSQSLRRALPHTKIDALETSVAASGRDQVWQVSTSALNFTLEPCKYLGWGSSRLEGGLCKMAPQGLPRNSVCTRESISAEGPSCTLPLRQFQALGNLVVCPCMGWTARKQR